MSMMSKLIEDLKELHSDMADVWTYEVSERDCRLVDEAINTIETLGTKVRANNLNKGWIPCEERLPKNGDRVLVSCDQGYVASVIYDKGFNCYTCFNGSVCRDNEFTDVIAWQPLPKPYREEQEQPSPRMTQEDREKFFRGE